MSDLRTILENIWDDGNAVGLDGWVGPGRGTEPIDDYAIRARDRAIGAAVTALQPGRSEAEPTYEWAVDYSKDNGHGRRWVDGWYGPTTEEAARSFAEHALDAKLKRRTAAGPWTDVPAARVADTTDTEGTN